MQCNSRTSVMAKTGEAKVSLTEILRWVDSHPFEFEELVAKKATQTAINRWHDINASASLHSEANKPQARKARSSVKSSVVKVPAKPRIAVDPTIVKRVSCLVKRHAGFQSSRLPSSILSHPDNKDNTNTYVDINEQTSSLFQDVSSTLDLETLGRRICRDVPLVVGAERAYVFLRHQGHGKKFVHFDSFGSAEVEANPFVNHVLSTASSILSTSKIRKNELDAHLYTADSTLRNFVAVPIISKEEGSEHTIGVLQVINKRDTDEDGFSEKDVQELKSFVGFCASAIGNAQMFQQALLECRWSNVLLELARNLFENLDSIDSVVSRIMVNAAALLTCEKCSVFMVNKETSELYAKVFDLSPEEEEQEEEKGSIPTYTAKEIRFEMDAGIAGYVARTGKTLNIEDAYNDERFNKDIDTKTGFKTHNILCMPIFDADKEVLGVAQLLNKDGGCFTAQDEHLFDAFAVYCGLSLTAVKMYEDLKKADAKNHVTMDVLTFHACASDDEAKALAKSEVPSSNQFKLLSLSMDVNEFKGDDTAKACLRMFIDAGFIHTFKIPYSALCRWILSVKRNYRDVPYHNWNHAFNVTQAMYCTLNKADLSQNLSACERLALLISCMCHDLDHRGTNNSFEGLKKSNLSTLYGTSTLERHHLDMCIMLLSAEGHNILVNLDIRTYRYVIALIEAAILATDLSVYLKLRQSYNDIIEKGSFEWNKDSHRSLFRSMLMTACDLSSIIRPWSIQQRVAETVYVEFHKQGDEERALGHTPGELNDAANAKKLPKMQVGFIDFICKPVYKTLAKHIPGLKCYLDELEINRAKWNEVESKGSYKMSVMTKRSAPEVKKIAAVSTRVNEYKPVSTTVLPKKSKACNIL